jgi:hypothetical protein
LVKLGPFAPLLEEGRSGSGHSYVYEHSYSLIARTQ